MRQTLRGWFLTAVQNPDAATGGANVPDSCLYYEMLDDLLGDAQKIHRSEPNLVLNPVHVQINPIGTVMY
ncbi:hypothetical protein F5984_13130 [Rudanella paleaurantiibacter]|uniref:Uncharacterized protein n=1 Tax=Rudanella paleaurantiibacter TaxID=2614655 RepID=A0A7J5U0K5_9BACT|nr:hypothetical protein [Rudanella paleaurantiibacter]KAB7730120.1 hypothetical protein F5984_13130 [Rudanella paleaurantiibacter]